MAAFIDEIPGLKGKPAEQAAPPPLERKPFFWDSIIFYLVSAILGLSVSGILVEFLRPDQNIVACFSELANRAQSTFVNSYCHKFLPTEEYFSVALIVHAAALIVPHYLWKVYVCAQIDFFFSHAAKLETLRDRDTGKYPHKNFSIVEHMHKEFYDRKIILVLYVAKLITQFVLVLLSLVVSAILFQDFDVTFDCHEEIRGSQLFGNATCAYARILFISVLRVADYLLLLVAMLVIAFGFYWCVVHTHPTELGHLATSLFCYDTCINSKHYKPKRRYRLKNDFQFLLVSLFSTNAGLGRVFKSVQIANDIDHELSAHLESLDSQDSMKHSVANRENDQKNNFYHFIRHYRNTISFQELMYDLCEGLSRYQEKTYGYETSRLAAMDIACGNHSYMFSIARWQLQLISITLDPYYKNQDKDKVFTTEEYHAGVIFMKIPTNLFGLPKIHKRNFSQKISDYIGLTNNLADEDPIKFNFIVIGALDSERKHNTVNQIIEMHSRSPHFFLKGAIMLIIKPVQVEHMDISHHFNDFAPEASSFWKPSYILSVLNGWPKDSATKEEVFSNGCVVKVMCGKTSCKFQLKAYEYIGYRDNNKSSSNNTLTVKPMNIFGTSHSRRPHSPTDIPVDDDDHHAYDRELLCATTESEI